MKPLLTFLLSSVILCDLSAPVKADQLGDWIRNQHAGRCFPWAITAKDAPVRNYLPKSIAGGMVTDLNALVKQMSGHSAGAPETGTFAIYDPVHRIVLASLGFGEDFSNDVLLTDVSPPPRTIAWRDLSHFNPGSHKVLGITRKELEARYGPANAVSRCGMQAITFDSKAPGGGYLTTYILREGRVVGYTSASP